MSFDLSIANVSHVYGKVQALEDVSVRIRAGEILAVIGPSGCGKSTLLGIVGGLIQPSAGTVEVTGSLPADLSGSAAAQLLLRVSCAGDRQAAAPHEAMPPYMACAALQVDRRWYRIRQSGRRTSRLHCLPFRQQLPDCE